MKAHLGIDARTLEIRAFEVTDNAIGDAPILLALLAPPPADEPIARVSADSAYDTPSCQATIAQRGAMAIIPTRNEALQATTRLGSKIWKKWSAYIAKV